MQPNDAAFMQGEDSYAAARMGLARAGGIATGGLATRVIGRESGRWRLEVGSAQCMLSLISQ